MKKIILLMLLFGIGLQANAYMSEDSLYETVNIPTSKRKNINNSKELYAEKNEIIEPQKEKEKFNLFNIKSNNDASSAVVKPDPKVEGNIYHPIMNMIGKYKSRINVVYTDIDGIIVPENKKTIAFKDSITRSVKKLKQNHIPVIFTTGRTYREAKRVAEALELNPEYYITQNGAEIVDSNGNLIYEASMKRSDILKFNEELRWFNYHYTQGLKMAVYERGNVYIRRGSNIPNIVDDPILYDNIFEIPKKTNFSKIRIYGDTPRNLDIFRRYLIRHYKRRFIVTSISPNYIDINIKKATKANAVKYLSEITGINLLNSAGFGYTQTDVCLMNLLRENGGLAISTEKSMQEVKNRSSYITKDFENDGFSFAIDAILGNNFILDAQRKK